MLAPVATRSYSPLPFNRLARVQRDAGHAGEDLSGDPGQRSVH
jgi:hypothetical protein